MSGGEVSGSKRSGSRVVLFAAAGGFLLVLLALTCLHVFRLFSIPSGGMAPTINIGDHVIVSRVAYGYSRYSFDWWTLPVEDRWPAGRLPERGDVVVFRTPGDHRIFYVKRIVGLPGDRIQVIDGVLHINGEPVKRERAGEAVQDVRCGFQIRRLSVPQYRETLPNGRTYITQKISEACAGGPTSDNTDVYVVPPNSYFMMGDNRDDFADSRFSVPSGVGYVPRELILGRVVTSL